MAIVDQLSCYARLLKFQVNFKLSYQLFFIFFFNEVFKLANNLIICSITHKIHFDQQCKVLRVQLTETYSRILGLVKNEHWFGSYIKFITI